MHPLFGKCATCSSNSGSQMKKGFCRRSGAILSTSLTFGRQCPHCPFRTAARAWGGDQWLIRTRTSIAAAIVAQGTGIFDLEQFNL